MQVGSKEDYTLDPSRERGKNGVKGKKTIGVEQCHIIGCEELIEGRYRCKDHLKRFVAAVNYQTTEEHIDELRSKECCDICGRKFASSYQQAIDHDHETGLIRGVLCGTCNRAIGQLGDDYQSIKRVMNYFDKAYGKE